MALSKEEIAIRLGVDTKGVTKGMVGLNNFMAQSLGEMQKKFHKFTTGLAAGFAVGAASDAVGVVIKLWEDAWNKIFQYASEAWYGFTKDAMDSADASASYWKKTRRSQTEGQSLEDEFAAKAAEAFYDAADFEGKKKILSDIKDEQSALAEKYESRMRQLKGLKGAESEYHENRNKYLRESIKLLETEEKLRKLIEKSPLPKIEELKPHTNEPLEEAPQLKDPMMRGIANYYKGVANSARNYGNASEADKYQTMADSFYKAQAKVAEEYVQKVSIVEVKE